MASGQVAKSLLTTPTQQARFELGVCMAIYDWEALSVAVQNFWGGPESADKRDWMVGSIVELYEQQQEVDSEDIEDRLLQIMQDEFEVVVDDDSAYGVAEGIVRIFGQCTEGDFSLVDSLYQKYLNKANRPSAPVNVTEQVDYVSSDEME
ncbi:Pre-rRNA-processing protein TSR2-domain-containing protein [Lipomyces kononenkoae]|uniref:Pre-rRNA-processing protein TSR2-domain-containing protein n=1 Tax=Lipomyces kononenkoae TaxID=34357 RepID=A0ACC3SYN6_LIPKO